MRKLFQKRPKWGKKYWIGQCYTSFVQIYVIGKRRPNSSPKYITRWLKESFRNNAHSENIKTVFKGVCQASSNVCSSMLLNVCFSRTPKQMWKISEKKYSLHCSGAVRWGKVIHFIPVGHSQKKYRSVFYIDLFLLFYSLPFPDLGALSCRSPATLSYTCLFFVIVLYGSSYFRAIKSNNFL